MSRGIRRWRWLGERCGRRALARAVAATVEAEVPAAAVAATWIAHATATRGAAVLRRPYSRAAVATEDGWLQCWRRRIPDPLPLSGGPGRGRRPAQSGGNDAAVSGKGGSPPLSYCTTRPPHSVAVPCPWTPMSMERRRPPLPRQRAWNRRWAWLAWLPARCAGDGGVAAMQAATAWQVGPALTSGGPQRAGLRSCGARTLTPAVAARSASRRRTGRQILPPAAAAASSNRRPRQRPVGRRPRPQQQQQAARRQQKQLRQHKRWQQQQ